MNSTTIYFAIRDDDTSYFTKPGDLESCYGKIWDICPISVSVVPFHACTKSGAVPKKYWTGNEIFPLDRNQELVAFLREGISRGRIYITLHGYHHRDEPGGYEFDVGQDLERKVVDGKVYLEELLGQEITVFVPPHNTLSVAGYHAVIKAGLDISGIQPFRPSFRGWAPQVTALGVMRRISRWQSGGLDRWPIVFPDGHCELPYHSLTPSANYQTLRSKLDRTCQMGGVVCIATHYWEFDEPGRTENSTIRDNLNELWDRMASIGDRVSFSTLASLRKAKNLRQSNTHRRKRDEP